MAKHGMADGDSRPEKEVGVDGKPFRIHRQPSPWHENDPTKVYEQESRASDGGQNGLSEAG